MNKIKMTGIGLIGLGTVEQAAGRVLGSRSLLARGFAHHVAGQSKVAIGTAMSRVGGRLHAVRQPAVAGSAIGAITGIAATEP